MSKKQKARIKDLERTIRASVARNALWAREHRELFDAYEAIRVERDDLKAIISGGDVLTVEYDDTYGQLLDAILIMESRNRWADRFEAQVKDFNLLKKERDELRHDLGECQAGREALQRYIDDLAPVAVWKAHAKETAAYADEMKAENAELLEKLHVAITTATNWEERFFNGEQLIVSVQSENAELREQLSTMKYEREELEVNFLMAQRWERYVLSMEERIAELKKELAESRDFIETAHRWKTYATSIESQIEILQTAIDERDERLGNIKFFLSDGDEG